MNPKKYLVRFVACGEGGPEELPWEEFECDGDLRSFAGQIERRETALSEEHKKPVRWALVSREGAIVGWNDAA